MRRIADENGLKALFDKYDLDALVCTLADAAAVPIFLAGPAKYVGKQLLAGIC